MYSPPPAFAGGGFRVSSDTGPRLFLPHSKRRPAGNRPPPGGGAFARGASAYAPGPQPGAAHAKAAVSSAGDSRPTKRTIGKSPPGLPRPKDAAAGAGGRQPRTGRPCDKARPKVSAFTMARRSFEIGRRPAAQPAGQRQALRPKDAAAAGAPPERHSVGRGRRRQAATNGTPLRQSPTESFCLYHGTALF